MYGEVYVDENVDVAERVSEAFGASASVARATEELLSRDGKRVSASKIAVQGMGNEGRQATKTLYDMGASVIGVSDVDGALFAPCGLNIEEVLAHMDSGRPISTYSKLGVYNIPAENLLYLACDVLIPAAEENQITGINYMHLKCKYLVEGTDGPTSSMAANLLTKKGVRFSPYQWSLQ